MSDPIAHPLTGGLERLCHTGDSLRMWRTDTHPGLEALHACFSGDVFEPHRHDSYAIGVTLDGVQRFRYRGEERHSLPGQVLVLHPDEEHDGGAATDASLVYAMLYISPSEIIRALPGRRGPLPFVAQPVLNDPAFRIGLTAAFATFELATESPHPDDDLALTALLTGVTDALTRHGSPLPPLRRRLPIRQVHHARSLLDDALGETVSSTDLEVATGLDRFTLSRAFRAIYGTSPHRYLLMRRLTYARRLIETGHPLAHAAAEAGFADQSHLTRHFKKTFGLTPGRWNEMTRH